MPGHGRSKFGLLCIVPLWFLPCTHGTVIEVTAGGVVSDPTYRFSDARGTELATLIGNATALTASGDVVTGDGGSAGGRPEINWKWNIKMEKSNISNIVC